MRNPDLSTAYRSDSTSLPAIQSNNAQAGGVTGYVSGTRFAHNVRILFPGLLLCLFLSDAGYADDSDAADLAVVPLDEIVVVAHKTQRLVRNVAANVTIISEEQLTRELATSVADALRYTPGIDYESGGSRFGTEGINIRGIGGNRVAVLIDGVPIGDQFDIGNFSNATRDFINAGFVERAEILRGPASALYGSSAIGGVVALRSPDPFNMAAGSGLGGRVDTLWRQADGSYHAGAMQAFAGERLGLLLGASLRDGNELESAAVSDNVDTRDYRRRSGIVKFIAEDAHGNYWKASYYGHHSRVGSDLNSMLGAGRFRRTTALEGDDRYRMNTFVGEYSFAADDAWIDSGIVRVYHSDTDIQQFTRDERALATRPVEIDRHFDFAQDIRGIELNLQKELRGDRITHQLGIGFEYRQRDTAEIRDGLETGLDDGIQSNVLLGEVFPLRDFPLNKAVDWGIYLEDSMSIDNWTAVVAVRADRFDMTPRNDPIYAEDFPFADPVSIDVSELSPKLGLIYHPSDSVDVYLQYAHGFRAPPFEDANIGLEIPVFNFRAIPNPDLRAESSDSVDFGFRWRGDRANVYLTVFRSEYDDFIESKVRLGMDPQSGRVLFQSQNIRRATIEGIEAGWSVDLDDVMSGLQFNGALYKARGENRDSGQRINSIGPAEAAMGVDWRSPGERWHAGLRAKFVSGWSVADASGAALFSPHGYAVLDLYGSRLVAENFSLRFGISNLADRTYWSWADVRNLNSDDPVIPFLARPGRTAMVGVSMNW